MSEEEREVSKDQWNRRTFLSFGALGLLGYGLFRGHRWIAEAEPVDGTPAPLRSVLEFNARVNALSKSDHHLVQEYPKERRLRKVRTNGTEGIETPLDAATWTLNVAAHGAQAAQQVTLDMIKALPKTEVVFDFKCIEGWSMITHWGGVRFRDFAEHFGVGWKSGSQVRFKYMALTTPDNGYYVGVDMESALHPQTILAYELNDNPLAEPHGAPLRLIIPTKYGVKNLKRIGTMAFSDERPPDYWAERGYDYDSGL